LPEHKGVRVLRLDRYDLRLGNFFPIILCPLKLTANLMVVVVVVVVVVVMDNAFFLAARKDGGNR